MRKNNLERFIDKGVLITTMDHMRTHKGTVQAMDNNMNVLLSNSTEFRHTLIQERERVNSREVGIVMFNGDHIITMTVEEPPSEMTTARAAGRGVPVVSTF